MLETIYATPSLPAEVRERRLLLSLLDRLRDQGQVVLDANRQLTRQLRRALDQEEIETRRLMASRVNELRLLLLGHYDELQGVDGIMVDERAELKLPLERPDFDPPEPIIIETKLQAAELGDIGDAAAQIAQAGLINFKRLLKTIHDSLERVRPHTGVLLSTVVELYPPKEGILDILGYLHIARMLGDDADVMVKHVFRWRDNNSTHEIVCPDVFFVSVEKAKT